MANLGIRTDAGGTFGAITLGGVDKVIVGNQGIEAGSFKPGAIVPADLAQKITLGTVQPTTTGAAFNFSIPAWAKRITVNFANISTNGTSIPQLLLGDSGGIEASGYAGAVSGLVGSVTTVNSTTGIILANNWTAAMVIHGSIVLTLLDPANAVWTVGGTLGRSDSAGTFVVGFSKSLSDVLTTVRLTTVNGTDVFDAGSVNILYEG